MFIKFSNSLLVLASALYAVNALNPNQHIEVKRDGEGQEQAQAQGDVTPDNHFFPQFPNMQHYDKPPTFNGGYVVSEESECDSDDDIIDLTKYQSCTVTSVQIVTATSTVSEDQTVTSVQMVTSTSTITENQTVTDTQIAIATSTVTEYVYKTDCAEPTEELEEPTIEGEFDDSELEVVRPIDYYRKLYYLKHHRFNHKYHPKHKFYSDSEDNSESDSGSNSEGSNGESGSGSNSEDTNGESGSGSNSEDTNGESGSGSNSEDTNGESGSGSNSENGSGSDSERKGNNGINYGGFQHDSKPVQQPEGNRFGSNDNKKVSSSVSSNNNLLDENEDKSAAFMIKPFTSYIILIALSLLFVLF